HKWIAPCAIRACGSRRFFPQKNDRRDEQQIEKQIGGNDVLEQLRINISVADPAGDWIRGRRAWECQESSPDSLRYGCRCGHVLCIRRSDAAEKQAITRHCVIDARARQDETIVAAES